MRILVADELAEAGVDALSASHEVDVRTDLGHDELVDIVGDYDAIVIRSGTAVDEELLDHADRLQVVGRAGVGLDNVDIPAATRHGVIVCNAPQSNIISAAEHTLGMLLALSRNIPQAHAALTVGRWERSRWKGTELHDKVLGILGLGRIGTLVAQRASAFGMRLIAHDPYVGAERARRMGVELRADLEGLLADADFVTVHLPRTPDTRGMIDAGALSRMKPSARLINVARGGIVDEQDLAGAVRDGEIAGAALDVFDEEPTTASPLFDLPEVVVTPHLGASTEEAQDKAGTQVAEAVNLALAGEFVPTAVNVQAGGVADAVRALRALAERLGRLVTALSDGGVGKLTIEHLGTIAEEDCRVIGLSVLQGLLSGVVHEPVTFVNAPLLAEERGIEVREISEARSADYVSLVRVSAVDGDGDTVRVAGTVLHPGERERLVEVWNAPVDIEPAAHMAFLRYEDRPGVIGTVGSRLGDAGVNIASAQVGRREQGGEAIMALSLDDPAPPGVIDDITDEIGATEGRAISLG